MTIFTVRKILVLPLDLDGQNNRQRGGRKRKSEDLGESSHFVLRNGKRYKKVESPHHGRRVRESFSRPDGGLE